MQCRRARIPPAGVHLNAYYGIPDQIIVVTQETGAVFIHGRTGTLYYFHEEMEGFVNADGETYLSFWEVENPAFAAPATPPSMRTNFATLPAAALSL